MAKPLWPSKQSYEFRFWGRSFQIGFDREWIKTVVRLIWSPSDLSTESDSIDAAISWSTFIPHLYFQICFTVLNFHNFVWQFMFFWFDLLHWLSNFVILKKLKWTINQDHPFSWSASPASLAKDRRHTYSGSPVSLVRTVSKFSHLNGNAWCLRSTKIWAAASVVRKSLSTWRNGNSSSLTN